MNPEVALTALAAVAASAVLTGVVRSFVAARGVVDVPNERSSHVTPTPRGGGLAIVLTTTVALAVLAWRHVIDPQLFAALTAGGLAVALVGFLDDRHALSPALRLAVHLAAACWAVAWLGGLPILEIGGRHISLGWGGYVLGALGIVWALNLFNFMDGIDGIAAAEAIFIAWAGAALSLFWGPAGGVSGAALVFGAACAGFLVWNWPPAKLFMGDVGSGYLGYFVAVLALAAARETPAALLVWLILGACFVVDATITLVRRCLRLERVMQAHRSHAYQRLARRWASHRRVTLLTTMVNLLWLLPCALLAALRPVLAGWIAIAAFAPIVVAVILAGAGRRESTAANED